MIFPDAMLGMLGGGQLGRMFTLAAHSMGYRVAVLDPDPLSPAGAIADVHLKAAYQDREALQQLSDSCAAVTTEFENVPAESLRWLASHCIVRPASEAVAVAQDRVRLPEDVAVLLHHRHEAVGVQRQVVRVSHPAEGAAGLDPLKHAA